MQPPFGGERVSNHLARYSYCTKMLPIGRLLATPGARFPWVVHLARAKPKEVIPRETISNVEFSICDGAHIRLILILSDQSLGQLESIGPGHHVAREDRFVNRLEHLSQGLAFTHAQLLEIMAIDQFLGP